MKYDISFKKISRHIATKKARAVLVSALILMSAAGYALYPVINAAHAGTTYYFDVYRTYWDGWTCYGGSLAGGAFFGSCDASTVGQWYSTIQCLGYYVCDAENSCGNIEYTSVTCMSQTTCTPDSSCAANTCSTGTCTDSCGNAYAGTKSCAVSCSVSNACGASNTGTYSGGVCSASAPALPAGYGSACTSAANSCGMTNPGTIGCSGSCSASTPSDSLCAPTYSEASYVPTYSQSYYQSSYAPTYSEASYYAEGSYAPSCTSPTVSISASPSRVKSGQTSTLTVTGTGISSSCVVSGPGVNTTIPASSCNASQTITTPAITARSTYSVTCDGGAATAKVIINMPFGILEF